MPESESTSGALLTRLAGVVERTPWLPTAAVGLLATLAMGGAVFFHPTTQAVGSAYTEALGHLWGLWCTAQGLWQHGPLVRVADVNYPEGYISHLMDPINLVVFLPPYWLMGGGAKGAALGWNALHAATTILGAVSCWKLGKRLVGDHPAAPWGIAVLALVFCMSPYLLQVPYMGRTEYLPAVLYPLHLALLHEWLRLPPGIDGGPGLTPAPRWTVGVASGLVLGAIALGGWYLAVFVFLLEAPFSLWLARRLPWRELIWRLAFVAVVGVLCAVPAALALVAYPPDGGSGFFKAGGMVMPLDTSGYPIASLTEVLRLAERRTVPQWMDQSPYVGVFALWVGVLGTARFRRPAIGWLVLAFWSLWLSFGPIMRLTLAPAGAMMASEGGELRTPVYWLLSTFDDLRPLRTWTRLAVLAALPAGVVAMYGYLAFAPRLSRMHAVFALPLMGLFLLDQATWPKYYSFDRPQMAAAAPAGLMEVLSKLPPGPVINFPIDTSLRQGGGPEIHGHYLLWQLDHRRPVPTSFRGIYDTTLNHSTLTRLAAMVSYANVLARGGSLDPAAELVTEPSTPSYAEIVCARADVPDLVQRGFTVATLQLDLAGSAGLTDFLVSVLGTPDVTADNAMGWDLTRVPVGNASSSGCELPQIPNKLLQRGG